MISEKKILSMITKFRKTTKNPIETYTNGECGGFAWGLYIVLKEHKEKPLLRTLVTGSRNDPFWVHTVVIWKNGYWDIRGKSSKWRAEQYFKKDLFFKTGKPRPYKWAPAFICFDEQDKYQIIHVAKKLDAIGKEIVDEYRTRSMEPKKR